MLFSKRAQKRRDVLTRSLRALVRQFGYQDVLRALVSMACDESLRGFKNRDPHRHLYGEAFTILDHAEKTLCTIVRLNAEITRATATNE